MAGGRAQPSGLDRAAGPVLQMIDDLDLHGGRGAARLLDQAQALLDRFEADALRDGVARPAIKPARYAMAVVLDHRARTLPLIELGSWSVLARRQLGIDET